VIFLIFSWFEVFVIFLDFLWSFEYFFCFQAPSCTCMLCKFEKENEASSKRRPQEYFQNPEEDVSSLHAGAPALPNFRDVCPSARGFLRGDPNPDRWISDELKMMRGGGMQFDKLVAKHIPNKEYAQKTVDSKKLMTDVQYHVHSNNVLAALDGVVGLKKYRIYSLLAKKRDDEDLDLSELMASFSTVLHNIVQEFIKEEKLKADDRMQIVMTTEKGMMNNPISSKIQKVKDFDVSSFLVHAAAYFQSDKTMKISDRIILELIHIRMDHNPKDIGVANGSKFKIVNLKKAVYKKRSCTPVMNADDNLCLARAIVLCLAKKGVLCEKVSSLFCEDEEEDKPFAHLLKETTCRFLNIKRTVETNQKDMANFFCRKGGVDLDKGGGVADIEAFESLLSIQIKIFDGCNFMKLIYSGRPSNDIVYLLRSEGGKPGTFHYDSIVNIRGFLGKHFCDFCNISYREKFTHRCRDVSDWCYTCNHRGCFEKKVDGFGERCNNCFRVFRSPFCKRIHAGPGSVCGFFKCFDCGHYLVRKRAKKDGVWVKETYKEVMDRHAGCSSKKCSICHEQVSDGHVCFMRKIQFKNFVKKVVYLDFETNFETGEHVPVFCNLKWVFRKSFDDKHQEIGEKSFGLSDDISNEVGEFLFSPFFKDSTIIAHNLRGFDGCFLIQYMTANSIKP